MPTEDGWEPSPRIEPDSPLLVWRQVPGSDVTIQVRNDDAGTLMLAYAADYHAFVEPLIDEQTACYTPWNSVDTSNHLNATAMDFNWGSYPWKVRGNLVGDKLARLRALLAYYDPWMFWAGDWDDAYVDEMHHQMNYGSYPRALRGELAAWVKANIGADGFSHYHRTDPVVPPPAPPPPPGDPHPREAAIQALYDAVPGIATLDDARPLIDQVMAGLALSECTNIERVAMWLAQIGWESGDFVYTEEINKVGAYAPYIGRTWIQITWQSNYAKFGQWCVQQGLLTDPDYFVNNPGALADAKWAGIGPAWYWTVERPQINGLCDQGDIVGVTQAINGGTNGLEDPSPGVPGRRTRYQQAIALGDELLALITPAAPPAPTPPVPDQGGPLDALTPDEQHELLDDVRWIREQMDVSRPDWGPDADLGTDTQGRPNNLRTAVAKVLRTVVKPAAAKAPKAPKGTAS